MIKNYLVITFRNLLKNSVYSFINIVGLAIGITCSILILLWVFDELSFDKMIPKADRIYQVRINAEFNGDVNTWRSVPLPTRMAMKDADIHIKNSVVTGWGSEHLLTVGETKVIKDGYWVSEEFLEMFQFPVIRGDVSTSLDNPSSIVITESAAKSLFGDEDPIGKSIRVDDKDNLMVTALLKDVPKNSSFQFEYLLPWKYRYQSQQWIKDNTENWGNNSFQVFIELDDKANMASVENNIQDMIIKHSEGDLQGYVRRFTLQNMLRWRLYSLYENGKEAGGMIDYVQLFTVIAIFILVIACINFMNLATARSEKRAREVGIRKSIGSSRFDLIIQFLGESLLIALIAFVIAVALAQLLLPYYNNLVDKHLYIDYTSMNFWLYGLRIILITGIFSGSYPAFYLSSFKPVKVLKGKISVGKRASTPRKVLVILQFGFSIFLIIGTIVIYRQIQLAKGRVLGYEQENLINVDDNFGIEKNYEVLKNELLRTSEVEAVTRSNSRITQINSNNFVGWPGKPEDQQVLFATITTEYDYTKTMGIKVLMGRDFSHDFKSDSSAILVNKEALDLMNLDDPIGTQLDLWGEKRTLIGVIGNVLMDSPYEPVRPLFVIMDNWGGPVTIRLRKTSDLSASLDVVKQVFEKYNSAYPFEYSFVDEDFQKKFTTINMTSTLANLFATLAIVITGLGLFGLASYMAEQRTKEISIRKVMGASISSLLTLMSTDFSKLVIISFVITSPIAWWLLDKYLQRYPVRTEIAWWVFPLTGAIALVFALVIVITQALRAAHANPASTLRNE